MGLKEYVRKRDFKKTSEPKGAVVAKGAGKSKGKPLTFVVQKHAASHLHYDFRIEMEGVLRSWAVPKGPSFDPTVKRLAMHVEDHPYEYGSFEGTIPQGEYGGGTVMLWDQGTWIPDGDNPVAAYHKGSLKFELKGTKLKGRWALFRIRTGGEKSWLLVKEKDKFAKSIKKYDVTTKEPLSVTTGRDLDEIANAKKKNVWGNKPERQLKKAAAKEITAKKSTPTKAAKPAKKLVKKKTPSLDELKNINITHPDKIYYKDKGYTKLDVIEYYVKASELMLEHISDRPIMVIRSPGGAETGKMFFQKHWTPSFPKAVKKIKSGTDEDDLITVDSVEGIIGLIQLGTLEIHIWNTHAQHIETPDQLVFDIDPDEGVTWKDITNTASIFRKRLEQIGLKSFLKTTGGKGLHVVTPLQPKFDWELAKQFAKAICEDIAAAEPDKYLLNMSKAKRKGKIFLDYLRNGRGSTAVAPYSTRARLGAPVSMPLSWDELGDEVRGNTFNIKNSDERFSENPWADFYKLKQVPKRK